MGLFNRTKKVDIFFVGSEGTEIDRGIYSFYIDINTGEIFKRKFTKAQASPLSMHKHGRWMYITYRNGSGNQVDGGIWQYACMDLQLGLAARVSHEGHTFFSTAVDGDRKYLYGVDYYNGEVVKSPIKKSKVVNIKVVDELKGKGIDPIKQTESHPSFVCVTPQNKILVTDMGGDEVILYDQGENGALIKDEECSFKVKDGSGPRKVVYSSRGHHAYMINEISSMINVYKINDGKYELIQEQLSYKEDECKHENTPTDIILSENGKYLFVSNKGDDTVVVFAVNEDGTIKRIDCMETDAGPIAMLIFKDRWLVVASKQSGTIESFEIREGERNGVLYETHSAFSLHQPVCMEKGAENQSVVMNMFN